MPFPWTLQRYIFREMGKTFLLAAVSLTGVLGLGEGMRSMIKLGEVTPGQLMRLMALVLPLAAALTLPVAALFSATSTYGRLSADNEFVACRSSGINLHVLFLPTLLLSLLAAGVSFTFTNFVIPGMVRNLNEFVRADVATLIRQGLNQPRGFRLGDYRIYADDTQVVPGEGNRIRLQGIAFVEVDGREWVRYGTARQVDLVLDRSPTGIRIAGWMRGLSCYDRKLNSFYEEAEQIIPPNDLPSPVPRNLKFLRLGELLHYWAVPTEWEEVRKKMRSLRRAMGVHLAYEDLWNDWEPDHELKLSDEDGRYTVRAGLAGLISGDRGLELHDVSIDENREGRRRTITAQRAVLELTHGDTLADVAIKIDLYDARLTRGDTTLERKKADLGPVKLDPMVAARVAALSDVALLEGVSPPGSAVAAKRQAARSERDETLRRIVGALNERTAFSVSVFVLVILGAALGIVMKGAHLMTSFGISFVPALVVLLTIVAGKQMSYNESTHVLGLLVLWSGILGVAGLDVWTLMRVLRR